jgi:clan AA aspartic protease (TIGR02281 family)
MRILNVGVFTNVLIVAFCAGSARADEVADAKAALEKAGVRVLSSGLALSNEGELAKELGKALFLKRNVVNAQKELQTAQLQFDNGQKMMTQLIQQHVQLSAQLANIDRNDVALNNKLVGALNALKGQYELGAQERDKFEAQLKTTRAKADEAREAYIQFVLNTRKLADDIEAQYAAKAADPDLSAALARINQARGKQFLMSPGAGFQANVRRLKQLEETVLSDSIELRDDGGRTLRVGVIVNGKYQQEMVLDSGASLISLPSAVATKLGVKPGEKDPKIVLQLADGSEIEGRLVKLASVRIGKFSVENVECAVLSAEAVNAEPLLGMSFLQNFKFEVDAAGKKLTMLKVAGTEPPTSRTAK